MQVHVTPHFGRRDFQANHEGIAISATRLEQLHRLQWTFLRLDVFAAKERTKWSLPSTFRFEGLSCNECCNYRTWEWIKTKYMGRKVQLARLLSVIVSRLPRVRWDRCTRPELPKCNFIHYLHHCSFSSLSALKWHFIPEGQNVVEMPVCTSWSCQYDHEKPHAHASVQFQKENRVGSRCCGGLELTWTAPMPPASESIWHQTCAKILNGKVSVSGAASLSPRNITCMQRMNKK